MSKDTRNRILSAGCYVDFRGGPKYLAMNDVLRTAPTSIGQISAIPAAGEDRN